MTFRKLYIIYTGIEQLNHRLFSHLQECYLMMVRHFASTTWRAFISHNYIIWVCTRTNTEALVCMCIETRKMELTFPPEKTAQDISCYNKSSQLITIKKTIDGLANTRGTSKPRLTLEHCFMWHGIESHFYNGDTVCL
jgi:hypothetical protein